MNIAAAIETLSLGQAAQWIALAVVYLVIGSVARRVRKLEGGK